jgi:hypothetical protein
MSARPSIAEMRFWMRRNKEDNRGKQHIAAQATLFIATILP